MYINYFPIMRWLDDSEVNRRVFQILLVHNQPWQIRKRGKTLSKSINCSSNFVFPLTNKQSLSLSTIDSSNPKLQWILPISPLPIVKSLASSSSSSLWHHFEELYPRIHRLHLQHCERWIRLLISFIYNIYQSYIRPSRMPQNSSEGAKISWDSAIPSVNISKKEINAQLFLKAAIFLRGCRSWLPTVQFAW